MRPQESGYPRGSVVIVDDDPDVRGTLALYLRSARYQAVIADRRDNVLSVVRVARPRAIVLDVGSDPSTNTDIIEGIRGDTHLARTPLIGLTTCSGPDEIAQIKAAGYDAVLLKPVSRDLLVESVRRVVDQGTPREK